MRVINLRLPENVAESIDKLAGIHGLSRSEIMRQAMTLYLHIIENVGTLLKPAAFHVKPAQVGYMRRGDVIVMKIPTGHAIVVSSASSGAVGPKALDALKVDGKVLGKYLARVALMDLIAVGAFPLLLSVTVANERNPTGDSVLKGVRNETSILGFDQNHIIMEKTEENFQTRQTGAGLTAVGLANDEELRLGRTAPGDIVVVVGKPKVGEEVLTAEVKGEIADVRTVMLLTQKKYVHDIAPCGNAGVCFEAQLLAHSVGRRFRIRENAKIALDKSAGPATAVVATLDLEKFEELAFSLKKPTEVVGEIL